MDTIGQHPTGVRAVEFRDRWHRRTGRALVRFARACHGVTAMEAAFILPIFFGFCFGFLETSMLYFNASVLEGQVAEASRQIRTGNVQAAADPQVAFRTILCNGHLALMDCNDIIVDVRNFGSFGTITYPDIFDADGDPTNAVFQPGASGAIVSVRALYKWEMMTPLLYVLLGDGNGSTTRTLAASAVFRTEPY